MLSLSTRTPGRIFSTAKTTSWCNRYSCRTPSVRRYVSLHLSKPDQYDQISVSLLPVFPLHFSVLLRPADFHSISKRKFGPEAVLPAVFNALLRCPAASVALGWRHKSILQMHSQRFTPTQPVYKHKIVIYLTLHNMYMSHFVCDLWKESCLYETWTKKLKPVSSSSFSCDRRRTWRCYAVIYPSTRPGTTSH